MTKLRVKELECGFSRNKSILNSINFEIDNSETVFVLGSNGIGKSCLLQTLGGAIEPLSGELPHLANSYLERARIISYCAQTNIEQSDLLVKTYLDLISPKHSDIFDLALDLLEVRSLLHRPMHLLSGGEQQRIRLTATLIQDSSYYLLDEPTNSLDPLPIKNLSTLLQQIRGFTKSSIVVSHDLNFAINTGTRFIGIHNENLIFDTSLDQLRIDRKLDHLYGLEFTWTQINQEKWVLC
tara:strand:+ start:9259 stop:9975 length:717 start_codon:yes stop_codon:yes gene_type:complete